MHQSGEHLDAWSAAEVGRWLSSIGLEQYAEVFVSQHVDGSSLRLLSRDDLNALGVVAVGHRLQILRGVSELCGEALRRTPGSRVPIAASAVRELRFSAKIGQEDDS